MRKEGQSSYFKEKWESFKAKGKETARKVADYPEYIAMGIGLGGVALSIFQPALLPASLTLLIQGGVSYSVTEQAFPKKRFEAKKSMMPVRATPSARSLSPVFP